jgi:hypothetical protein
VNDFETIQSGSGLLKDSYGDSGMAEALKRKRERLKETRLGDQNEDDSKEG